MELFLLWVLGTTMLLKPLGTFILALLRFSAATKHPFLFKSVLLLSSVTLSSRGFFFFFTCWQLLLFLVTSLTCVCSFIHSFGKMESGDTIVSNTRCSSCSHRVLHTLSSFTVYNSFPIPPCCCRCLFF